MDVCHIAASGNTFVLIYVRLYVGGGAFTIKLSIKILVKLLTVIKVITIVSWFHVIMRERLWVLYSTQLLALCSLVYTKLYIYMICAVLCVPSSIWFY